MGLASTDRDDTEQLRFFHQGAHDGLCGFYAVLNAFRYLQRESGHSYLRDDDSAFFDEAVECLARVPGVDIRILKGDHAVGGIDQFQIRDLCRTFSERIDMEIAIELVTPSRPMPFRRGYRALMAQQKSFAMIMTHRDGSHWVVAVPGRSNAYATIDDGQLTVIHFDDYRASPFASDAGVILMQDIRR